MKNIVENQDIKTDKPLPMSYEALKAERDAQQKRADALAVENQALKAAGNKMFLSAIGLMEDPDLKIDHARDIKDWERNETPATDAALAAIRDAVLDQVIAKLGAMGSPDFTLMAVQALKNELREAK